MSLSGTITMVGAVWGREWRAASCGLSETQNALPETTATDSKKRRTSISLIREDAPLMCCAGGQARPDGCHHEKVANYEHPHTHGRGSQGTRQWAQGR